MACSLTGLACKITFPQKLFFWRIIFMCLISMFYEMGHLLYMPYALFTWILYQCYKNNNIYNSETCNKSISYFLPLWRRIYDPNYINANNISKEIWKVLMKKSVGWKDMVYLSLLTKCLPCMNRRWHIQRPGICCGIKKCSKGI